MRWLAVLACCLASCKTPTAAVQEAPNVPAERVLPSKAVWLEVLIADPTREIDLAEAGTIIANSILGRAYGSSAIHAALQPCINRAAARMNSGWGAEEKIALLNQEVLPEIRRKLRGELSWLNQAFGASEGGCLPNTLLYLIAADKIGLPLSAVVAPRHVFVCYSSGSTRRNIETTAEGRALTAVEYRKVTAFKESELAFEVLPEEESALLKSLAPITRREFVSLIILQQNEATFTTLEACEEAMRLTPKSYLPIKRLAARLITRGEIVKGQEWVAKGMALAPHDPFFHIARCWFHIIEKKYREAIADADAALALAPNYGAYHYWKSFAFYLAENYLAALESAERAVRLAPGAADCWELRGNCYEKIRRYAEAAADLSKAIELSPRQSKFYKRRANIWAMLGDEDKWAADSKKAKELDDSP